MKEAIGGFDLSETMGEAERRAQTRAAELLCFVLGAKGMQLLLRNLSLVRLVNEARLVRDWSCVDTAMVVTCRRLKLKKSLLNPNCLISDF